MRLVWLGFFLAFVYVLLHWLQFFVQIRYGDFGLLGSSLALVFSVIGIWFGRNLSNRPQKDLSENRPLPQVKDLFSAPGPLSPREMEVLVRMAEGKSNQEIAESLFISTNTIKTHVTRIYEKLDVKRRTEAISKARKLGMLEIEV